MAIDKALTPRPNGVGAPPTGAELEIEIVNPDMVTLDDGSVEVTLIPDKESGDDSFDSNLAETLDEDVLQKLTEEVIGLVDADIESRKDWADTFVKGLDVLGFKY